MSKYAEISKEIIELEANELLRASKLVGDEMDKAVELISCIKGKLIVTGVGKSGLIGAKIAATLASTGTSSFFLHPTEAMHGDLGMIDKNDALLAISYSGESSELVNILPHVKRFDIPLIGMAKDEKSTLGRYSDVFIPLCITKEACPLNAAPTTSTTLTLALGDALAVCLMEKTGFKQEDFASFHPGGSLGKRLFVKVKDMARSEDLPIVGSNTPLKKAIVKMSEGRLGSLLLVDENGKLEAVLSDGDLRRALMRKDFSLEEKSINYATKNPITLKDENMLASDALHYVEKHKIQLVVITDNTNKPVGVLHVHDLIEAGIK